MADWTHLVVLYGTFLHTWKWFLTHFDIFGGVICHIWTYLEVRFGTFGHIWKLKSEKSLLDAGGKEYQLLFPICTYKSISSQ